jgi:hypothetical protein
MGSVHPKRIAAALLASCSFVFGAEEAQPLAGRIVVRESRLSASASAPRSRISAPEPPPPKAQLDS